jgi:AAA+ superfamily predicted ATPase
MQQGTKEAVLVELLAGVMAAGVAALALTFSFRILDPNRASREAAAAKKKEIARRLGRPNIRTNQYEDIIAGDVANPHEISTTFDAIGGLGETKRALQEIVILPLLRPELFASGNLLKPVKGCMLYGPPGTGKTLLAKALAKECQACFINVRTSTLQSKWFGDANKLVAAVFSLAWKLQPSIIFIDEVDSFLGARKNSEHEANTSMKTEFMTMWDGFQTNEHARVMVLAATNRPWEVDEAILRRLPRSFEVGLPDFANRCDILSVVLKGESVEPGFFGPDPNAPVFQIARRTERYSGSDLKELCKSAAYGPIRDLLRAEAAERRLTRRTMIPTEEAFEDAAESFSRDPPARRVKRAMTMRDFDEVLGKSSTSAEAAAAYRHAEAERRFERDARAGAEFGGGRSRGVGDRGGFGGGAGADEMAEAALSAVTPELLAQMVAALGGLDPRRTAAAAPKPAASAPPAEVTPEMLGKLMEQFMTQHATQDSSGRGAPNAPAPPGGSGGGAGAAGGLD